MNIIHAVRTLPRLVDDALAARLRVMPAVVLTGARQTGKSTLVEKLVPGERRYRSLDDFDVRDAARRDPEALLGGADPLTLDEVQREPLPSRGPGDPRAPTPGMTWKAVPSRPVSACPTVLVTLPRKATAATAAM